LKCTHQRHPSFTFKIEKKNHYCSIIHCSTTAANTANAAAAQEKVSKKALCVKIILSSELFFSQP
jgi:hypothetical protein